jgi:hypothetical protein
MDRGADRLAELIEARSSALVASLLSEPRVDTLQPAALSWLRQWGPTGVAPKPPSCRCAVGACQICN